MIRSQRALSLISLLLVGMIFSTAAIAQNKFTLNGYIKDSSNGESIIGATVAINGKSITSNQYGFYSITLESGEYDALVTHVSYLTQSFHLSLNNNIQHNIFLLPKSSALTEVVVYSKRKDANIRNAQMGKVDLSINQIKNIPAFMGEVDILKAIQLMPGVRNAGEGNAGFYVRGGARPKFNFVRRCCCL